MQIRSLQAGDEAAMRRFLDRTPEGDRRLFNEDSLDDATVARWLQGGRTRRLVAVDDDGEVRGYAAVVPGVGWSAHVGELQVVVDPDVRRQGLGSDLVFHALQLTGELELAKLVVEVVAGHAEDVAMFQALGFEREAVLPGHVRDGEGREHDLLLLANSGMPAVEYEGANS
jgi:L-amino acid N-acyltransferase YncA